MLTDAAAPRPEHRVAAGPARRPRVLQVVDSLDAGGAERHVVDLALALAGRGHDVEVACSAGGPLAAELHRAGLAVHELGPALVKRRTCATYAARLRALVADRRPDVVHAHIHASAAAAADATAGTAAALVVTEHTEAPWRGADDLRVARGVYRRAGALLAVSTEIARQLRAVHGAPAGRVRVVPPAVPPGRARPVPRPARWRGRAVVGRVCRLQPEKGVDVLLRAAALVPGALFVVAGDGPLRDELAALARDLGVADRVEFLGHRPDARALIGALDVLALTSRSEGTPLVVFEAFAAGVPVVASAVGGVPDQVRDGCEGFLVPPDDPTALAAALRRAVAERPRLAAAARRRAAAFPYAAMVDAVQQAYAAAVRVGAPA